MMKRRSAMSADTPVVKETVDMFLSRGGTITRCPSRRAIGSTMYTSVLAIDGYELPLMTTATPEYLPNFVCDVNTYDTAQEHPMSPHDDGTALLVREDAARAAKPSTDWATTVAARYRREDSDSMEDR